MAIFKNNPPIVTNGLVLYLDAANQQSYISGSTTWQDLSGNNNSGSLVNGPTFSTDGGGSIVFDGTNQRINSTSFSVPFLTLSTWVFRTSTVNSQGICRKQNGWAVSQAFGVLQVAPGTSWQFYNTGYVIPLNTWVNITYRYIGNGSNSQSVFINGVLIWTNSNGTGSLPTNSNQVRIGFDDNNWWWGGRISQTQIYNRALSQAEITQNYNATKTRFGLT